MFFNPLFISNASAGNNASKNADSTKEGKFTNSSYLFADIINVSKEEVSNSDLNLELDSNTLSLFNNFKNSNIALPKKTDASKNQFLGNVKDLTAFLSNLVGTEPDNSSTALNKKNKSESSDVSIIPEQIALLVDKLNSGEKISVPINNDGKTIFVEIQKFDSTYKETTSKSIKLTTSESKGIQLSGSDFENIIADIKLALKDSFSSDVFNMKDEKVEAIVTKIETDFSKLEFIKNGGFQPQKNILGNLINNIESEFNLNDSESGELKNIIVAEFVKVIYENSGKEKALQDNSGLVSIENLELNPKENKLIRDFNTTVVDTSEAKEKIKVALSKYGSNPELQNLLGKLEKHLISNNSNVKNNTTVEALNIKEVVKEMNLTSKEIKILNKLTSEKVLLPELSKELKVELTKTDSTPELKTFAQKLDKYIAANKVDVKSNSTLEVISTKEVVKELNLTSKEIKILNKLTSEKVLLPELSKELKVELTKTDSTPELKIFAQKLDKYIATNNADVKNSNTVETINLKEISKELKLTSTENKLISELNVEKVDLNELQKSIKTEIIKNPVNPELKALLSKLEKFESVSKIDLAKPIASNNVTTVDSKVKSGVKNILQTSDIQKSNTENNKSDYLFTLKSEKSPESLVLDKNLTIEKKNSDLLKTSIYSSKETDVLTKVKVIPITSEVNKNEFRVSDDNNRKEILRKVNSELKVALPVSNKKNMASENNTFQNEQNQNKKELPSVELNVVENTKQSTNKEVENYSNSVIKKETISQKEISHETKGSVSEIKVSETSMPKASFVEHQIRNQLLNKNEKIVYKKVDIQNFKKEISHLIQKGEKKSIEFQLNPENLGKVSIKLEVINKIVSASIKVENETTQQILQNSMDGLKTSLNQSGVQVNSLNVSLSSSEDKNQRYFKQKRKNNNNAKMNVEGFDEKFSHKNLGYNNYDFIA